MSEPNEELINIKNNNFSIPLDENNIKSTVKMLPLIPILVNNRGTGAGGCETNKYGKAFEEKTNNEMRLLSDGFMKHNISQLSNTTKKSNKPTTKNQIYDYYLSKTDEYKTIIFVLQNGLKKYMKMKYDIDIIRSPDEAYIIEYNDGRKVLKILEKKEQRVEGSVETKLWSGPSLKREYEIILGNSFTVYYGYCVSSFLKTKITSSEKKYIILNQIFIENNIGCLFGDDEDYFTKLDIWINNSL
jgi:hypothetical protein